ncbi:MAG: membrane protein insertion efficiency factor YidD [Spirochaetota bacterium]|nr:membrane protein insertion efficiency factor YidD [Spirochaetota bacterium]
MFKPLVLIIIVFIKLYKLLISPFLPSACRFYPTCSVYTMHALKKHGLLKGIFLSFKRILRCNPFCSGGYDPIP